MSLNKVMLIGNVGRDPMIRHLENGTPVATFSLATTERFRDKSGVQREVTEWHNIVCWRNLADLCEKYIRKGSQLYIEGSIRTRSWDGNDGQKRYTTEIVADNLQMLGRKSDDQQYQSGYGNQGQYEQRRSQAPAQSGTQASGHEDIPDIPEEGFSEDDLPF